MIPVLGRSPGEGKGYPLQYSGLENSMGYTVHGVAKNPSAIQETWVQSLYWEDPLEKGTATNSSILAWRENPMDYTVHGVAESDTTEQLSHLLFTF